MIRPVLLVNTNVVRPPVSPVGLEYVAQSLVDAGVYVNVLDLSFEPDWKLALGRALAGKEPLLVGMAVRNTDDCSFVTRKSFLPWIQEVVAELRLLTAAKLVLGGGGFTIMPEVVMSAVQADIGITGDGEKALVALARSLERGEDITRLPGLVYRYGGQVVSNPRADIDLRRIPGTRRRIFNNKKYQQLGAMVGIETKRGCSQKCIFCADPVAKGKKLRLRPPEIMAKEFADLVEQGVSWFHLCDSEFNLPLSHAKAVCRAIIDEGIEDRIKWYTYCAPAPFDAELASLMKRAGCAGINFGVDSLDDGQLRRLGKRYSAEDVAQVAGLVRGENLSYICDMLVGGPGETPETVKTTVDTARELDMPLVGIAAGVRVYPRTVMAQAVAEGRIKEGLHPGPDEELRQPLFYISPALGDDVLGLLSRLVEGDPRFLVLAAPSDAGSYNYAGDSWLSSLIEKGERGAYWDIISRGRREENRRGSARVP